MATFNLRRFSKPEMLRKIDRSHLVTFFELYTEYLSGRGIALPSAADENGLDYSVMSNVLLNPNTSTPPECRKLSITSMRWRSRRAST